MKLVAFDTAKNRMGVAVFLDGSLVSLGELRPVGSGPRHAWWEWSAATVASPPTKKGGAHRAPAHAGLERRESFASLREALLAVLDGADVVVIESSWVGARPSAGLSGARMAGSIEVLASATAKLHFVTPGDWRKAVGTILSSPFPGDREAAKAKAVALGLQLVGRDTTDNEAEALLIGLWGLVAVCAQPMPQTRLVG